LIGPIRVLLVDDQKLFREGMSGILRSLPEFKLIGECSTVRDAIELMQRSEPDLILLDVSLPGEHAADLLASLPRSSRCKVLLLTGLEYTPEIAQLLNTGAHGIYSKTSGSARLAEAMHAVLSGIIWLDEVYKRHLIAAASQVRDTAKVPATSAREHQILEAVVTGMTNKEIATKLVVSEPSVKAGLQRLFKKFGVANRAQLVAVAGRSVRQEH
jgi:DNA-binding NarL/FixJ family response regulator